MVGARNTKPQPRDSQKHPTSTLCTCTTELQTKMWRPECCPSDAARHIQTNLRVTASELCPSCQASWLSACDTVSQYHKGLSFSIPNSAPASLFLAPRPLSQLPCMYVSFLFVGHLPRLPSCSQSLSTKRDARLYSFICLCAFAASNSQMSRFGEKGDYASRKVK